MEKNIIQNASMYREQLNKRRKRNKVLLLLSCIVVFCTVYTLVLPAITMESDVSKELACTYDSLKLHVHSDECHDQNDEIICGYADYVVHTHNSNCYDPLGDIICTLPEVKCHTHGEECYEIIPVEADGKVDEEPITEVEPANEEETVGDNLVSDNSEEQEPSVEAEPASEEGTVDDTLVPSNSEQQETTTETEPGNVEEPEVEKRLICEKPEIILHQHSEECVNSEDIYECGKLETVEHNHGDSCFIEVKRDEEKSNNLEEQLDEEEPNNLEEQQLEEQLDKEELSKLDNMQSNNIQSNTFNLMAIDDPYAVYVRTQNELQTAINNGSSYITLGGNFGVYIKDSEGDGYGSLSSSLVIPSGKSITIDLNGYTIWQHGSDALFTIGSNSTLNIVDTKATAETVEYPGGSVVSNNGTAALDDGKVTLTYYVTDSDVTNSATGTTKETLEKHTVTSSGAIISNDQITFDVTGGTLNIQSGIVYGGTNYAIRQTSGTTTVEGGYICGFTTNKDGGAIYTSGGTLNVDDSAVIAVNSGLRGGGIFATNTDVNINGGVIASNISSRSESSGEDATHYGGGGICINNGTLDITAGYITNNYVKSKGYFDGGGGVLACGNCYVTVTGGYITGNEASSGGGIRTNWKNGVEIDIKGGYICSNVARTSEGGGVAVNMNGTGVISGGYINNNATNTNSDWGGGGVFCSAGSYLYIQNALVIDNNAGGFGGGVAGCSTGRTYLFVKNGAAVYNNSASGQNMSGATSTKNEDHIYAKNNEVFMNNGYQDYFCALNSIVEGSMLGGHSAGWHGSADGVPVKPAADDTLVAAYIMGLTADPTEQAKVAAQQLAKVYITGNSSYTHGGGILCNGYMIIGETDNIDLGARIELKAYKDYLDDNASKIELEEGQFTFEVVDAKTDAVIATATNDSKGAINFKERLSFTKDGQYIYYIREIKGEENKISYDGTVYRLTVDVIKRTSFFDDVLINGETITINKTEYLLDRIAIEKRSELGNWESVSVNENPSNSDSSAITLELTASSTFTNVYHSTKNIEVVKQWDDNNDNNRPNTVVVDLLRNGEIFDTVTLSSQNDWHHIWEKLSIEDDKGNEYEYTIKERSIVGYVTEYEEITENAITGYWLPATSVVEGGKYIIVSPDYKQVLYVTDDKSNAGFTTNEKSSVTTESIIYKGTTYLNAISESIIGSRNTFRAEITSSNNNKRIVFKNLGTSSTSLLLAQEANNNFLKGTTSATYSSGIKLENGKIRIQQNWDTANAWRYLSYENGKFTTNTSGNNAALLYEYKETSVNSITKYKIINRNIDIVDFSINITKVSAEDSKMTLSGAEFNLLTSTDSEPLYFIMTSNGVYEKSTANAEGATQKLITNNNGKLVLQGLEAGRYILRETKAPNGYQPIEDMNITLGESNENGDIPLVVRETIKDNVIHYKLPETGGIGTALYRIGGILLILLSAILLLCKYRKKLKGGFKTS